MQADVPLLVLQFIRSYNNGPSVQYGGVATLRNADGVCYPLSTRKSGIHVMDAQGGSAAGGGMKMWGQNMSLRAHVLM